MSEKSPPPVEELSFEAALRELESIVEQLEEGEHPLEESIALFERGQALQRHCTRLLEQAQLRVQQYSDGALNDFEGGI